MHAASIFVFVCVLSFVAGWSGTEEQRDARRLMMNYKSSKSARWSPTRPQTHVWHKNPIHRQYVHPKGGAMMIRSTAPLNQKYHGSMYTMVCRYCYKGTIMKKTRVFYKDKGRGKGYFVGVHSPQARPTTAPTTRHSTSTTAPTSKSPTTFPSTAHPTNGPSLPPFLTQQPTPPLTRVWQQVGSAFPGTLRLSDDGQYVASLSYSQSQNKFIAAVFAYDDNLDEWNQVGDLNEVISSVGISAPTEIDISSDGKTVGIISIMGEYAANTFEWSPTQSQWVQKGNTILFQPCTINDHAYLSGAATHLLINSACSKGQVYEYSSQLNEWIPLGQSVSSVSDQASISDNGQRIAVYGDALDLNNCDPCQGLVIYEFNQSSNTWVPFSTVSQNFGKFALSGNGMHLVANDEIEQTVKMFDFDGTGWVNTALLAQGDIYTFAEISNDGNRVIFTCLVATGNTETIAAVYAEFVGGSWQVSDVAFSPMQDSINDVTAFAGDAENRIAIRTNVATETGMQSLSQVWGFPLFRQQRIRRLCQQQQIRLNNQTALWRMGANRIDF